MRHILRNMALAMVFTLSACSQSAEPGRVFTITDYLDAAAAPADCADGINACIEACAKAGGGRVTVPAGEYVCSTIHLKSNVDFHLEEGAVIKAIMDPEQYDSYIPEHDMSRYDSGDGTVNSNNSRDVRWNRALVLGVGLENVKISGKGTINGAHVFDPKGEEYMRGPHTVLLAECKNLSLKDFNITCAANYAVMAYAIEDAVFDSMHITEGWDGIHIRGGKNVVIQDCRMETGDDALAGGYWENMCIKDCYCNSSCNGLRMIMPCDGLLVENCRFEGPGHYPHRTSGEARRCNMLFGISLEPGGWGAAPGDVKSVVIRNCSMQDLSSPVSVSISKDNHAYDLTIENLDARGLTGTVSPTVCWNDCGFDCITIRNCTVGK